MIGGKLTPLQNLLGTSLAVRARMHRARKLSKKGIALCKEGGSALQH